MTEPRRFELSGRRIWVAGHRGMVGSALVRRLASEPCDVLTVGRDALDLRRQAEVEDWLAAARPDGIFLAAATVGGIHANDRRPAEFLYDNLMIEANVIRGAHRTGVPRLMFFASSCIFPREAPQPYDEDALLTGPLEPTSQWYAVAKIAGIKLCQAFRRQHGADFVSIMPCSLYGPNDNFDPASSHVLPALIRKMDDAVREGRSEVEIWGSGRPRREFLHVDDLADAAVFLMERLDDERAINVGAGDDISIADLAALIAAASGYRGRLRFDSTKPEGVMRKLIDSRRVRALGWRPGIALADGVRDTVDWYRRNVAPPPG